MHLALLTVIYPLSKVVGVGRRGLHQDDHAVGGGQVRLREVHSRGAGGSGKRGVLSGPSWSGWGDRQGLGQQWILER